MTEEMALFHGVSGQPLMYWDKLSGLHAMRARIRNLHREGDAFAPGGAQHTTEPVEAHIVTLKSPEMTEDDADTVWVFSFIFDYYYNTDALAPAQAQATAMLQDALPGLVYYDRVEPLLGSDVEAAYITHGEDFVPDVGVVEMPAILHVFIRGGLAPHEIDGITEIVYAYNSAYGFMFRPAEDAEETTEESTEEGQE